jgi:hypothetical protein
MPPMRAMLLEYPRDANMASEDAQYMLGSALLVRPVVKEVSMCVILRLSHAMYDRTSSMRQLRCRRAATCGLIDVVGTRCVRVPVLRALSLTMHACIVVGTRAASASRST